MEEDSRQIQNVEAGFDVHHAALAIMRITSKPSVKLFKGRVADHPGFGAFARWVGPDPPLSELSTCKERRDSFRFVVLSLRTWTS